MSRLDWRESHTEGGRIESTSSLNSEPHELRSGEGMVLQGDLGVDCTSCMSCYSLFYSSLFTGSLLNPAVLSQEQDKADTEGNISRIRSICYMYKGQRSGGWGRLVRGYSFSRCCDR